MGVKLLERNKSKIEFDNAYYAMYDDAVKLVNNKFGATEEQIEEMGIYLDRTCEKIMDSIYDIGKHIKLANSIYPLYQSEYEERRIQQDLAIGLCYDVTNKYYLLTRTLGTKGNKYVQEAEHINHELNCLKKWRSSDKKRYENFDLK